MLKKVLLSVATAATLSLASIGGAAAHPAPYPHVHDRYAGPPHHRVHCWTEQRRVTIWHNGHRVKVWRPVRVCR